MKNVIIKYLFLTFIFISYVFSVKAQQIHEADSLPVYLTAGSAMATSTVDGDKLLNRSSINPANTLFGNLNGLTVLQGSGYGSIGEANPTMYIRGIGTFNNNSILVLIDGMERPLNSLVTEEIENVTILKDASSLALYGMRGANGVLLVTTKRGKSAKVDINISYQHGFTFPTRLPKIANAFSTVKAMNEGLKNEGLAPRFSFQELAAYENKTYPFLFPDVNWVDETLRDMGNRDQMNFSANGGSDRIRFFSLINIISDRGLIKETNLNPTFTTQLMSTILNVRTNLDVNLTTTTLLQANVLARISEVNKPAAYITSASTVPTGEGGLMSALYTLPSNAYPIKNFRGTWGGGSSLYPSNPVAQTSSRGYGTEHARGSYIDLLLKQDLSMIVDGLNIEGKIGFDTYSSSYDARTKMFLSESVVARLNDTGIPVDTTITQYDRDEVDMSFASSLGDHRRYNSIQFRLNYNNSIGAGNLASFLMYRQDNRVEPGQFNSSIRQDIMAFGHYSLLDRYYVDLTLGTSGTSRLPKGSRWGFFPAAAVAWRVSQEAFLENANWLDEMKLRLSYGITGNDRVTVDLDKYPFDGQGTYYFRDTYVSNSGFAEQHLPSKRVTFEKTRMVNFGFETQLFKMLAINADVFYNKTYDIMVSTAGTTSSMLGVTNAFKSDGIVKNSGMELGLSLSDQTGDFKYFIKGQVSYAKNEIVNMNEEYLPYDYLKRTGRPVGQMFGMENIGFFNSQADIDGSPLQMFSTVYPGDFKYKNQNPNDDNQIDEFDRVPIGYNNICPELNYSATVNLEYKGFGVSALLQGIGNYSVYLNTPSLYFPLMSNRGISEHYLESYWSAGSSNADAKYPRLTTTESANNYRQNSVFIADASYIKLRSAEVYYNMPKSFISKMRLEECKIFARGMDLLSIDKIKLTDPEVRGTVYPALKSYHIGFSFTF